MKPRKIG